jgi:hypothetical protein
MKVQSFLIQALVVLFPIAAFQPISRTSQLTRGWTTTTTEIRSTEEAVVFVDPFAQYKRGSDLAWKDTKEGTGDVVEEGDVLTVAYTGYLFSTKQEFGKNKGLTFKLGGGNVMPGFDQGVRGIKEGGKRIIRVPPALAYKDKGAGDGKIPPNSDLEIDIEVTKVYKGVLGDVALIGQNRLIGFAILLAISILAPMLGIGERGFI